MSDNRMTKRPHSAIEKGTKFNYGKDQPVNKLYRAHKPWVVWTTKPFGLPTNKSGKANKSLHEVTKKAPTKSTSVGNEDRTETCTAADSTLHGNSVTMNKEREITDDSLENVDNTNMDTIDYTNPKPDKQLGDNDSGFEVSSTGSGISNRSSRPLFPSNNRVNPMYVDNTPIKKEAGKGLAADTFHTNAIPDKDNLTRAVNRRKLLILLALLLMLIVATLFIPLALYMKNSCHSSSCENAGSCVNVFNGYKCFCRDGFTGDNCEVNINECESNPCFNNATCLDDIYRFFCVCPAGFTSSLCEVDIDECGSNPCQNSGTCADFVDEFVCACQQGNTGVTCETDMDECASSPCVFGECIEDAHVHGYICFCETGYTGVNCNVNINECESNPCFNNATCLDNIDRFFCVCPAGFTSSLCEVDIDECGSNPCQNGGTCADFVDEFVCACQQGNTGVICETDLDECASSPCVFGDCIEDAHVHGYICFCETGYTGVNCDVNIDECASNPCEGVSDCEDLVNGFTCICESGLFGVACQFRYSYIYACCSDPCHNGGGCNLLSGGFTCTCAAGFTGTLCEVNINECASGPCRNGATCEDRVPGYVCTCREGFEGTYCEYQTNDIVLLLDATGSMSVVSEDVYDVMSAIVNALTISQTTSRIALVSWNNAVYRHWDFTSHICYNSQLILDNLSVVTYFGGGIRPYDGFIEARDIFRAQNREYSRNYIIYVSDGIESTYNAEWVRNTLGSSAYGDETARIILIGTSRSGIGWSNLILFNNAESDRFDFETTNVAQLVADIIQA